MKFLKLGKYLDILLSMAIFLVIYSCVLGLNYLISLQLTDDAHALQLASRQTRLNQQIISELYAIEDALETDKSIDNPVLLLTQTYRQFDEVLNSFIYGGELIGAGQGQDSLLIDTNYAQVNIELLKQIEIEWNIYSKAINPVIYSIYEDEFIKEDVLKDTISAIASGRQANAKMLQLLSDFSVAVEDLGRSKVERLQFIQTAGITVAVIYFFILMFYFIRKLASSDSAAAIAQKEVEEILATVSDGLFLVNKDMVVGSQYSASLSTLLNKHDIAGTNFFTLIKPMVSEKTLRTSSEFMEMMFADHVEPSLIQSLNPLNQVEMQISQTDGSFEQRHFTFSFSPVSDHGQLSHLLVSIVDITERINLEIELDQSRQNSNKQLDMLMSVIHVNPTLLATGIRSTEQGLEKINELLRTPANNDAQLWKKHRDIARIAHRIKGDCAAIELNYLADTMHDMEDELERISHNGNILGNDFLPITVKLTHIHSQLDSLRSAIYTLKGIQGAIGESHTSSTLTNNDEVNSSQLRVVDAESHAGINQQVAQWPKLISKLAADIAHQYDKKVWVDTKQLNLHNIPLENFAAIKDVLIQLVRNAAVHGIENPDARAAKGKRVTGRITIYSGEDKRGLFVGVHDDGRGIHLKEIREKLIKNQALSVSEVKNLSQKQLLKYLFEQGFSTADTVDMNAGRGIGLDLVKSNIDAAGAKLGLNFKPDSFTEFKIRFPIAKNEPSKRAIA
jgi:two-component system chemotaxis sensor kinase CheA